MKQFSRFSATLCVSFAFSAVSQAASVVFSADIENFGASGGGDGTNVTPELVVSHVFALPAITSLDGVSAQLSHSWGSDITIELIAPDTTTYFIVLGDGPSGNPHQGPGDADDLGDGGSQLSGVADYTIVQSGTTGTAWLNNGSPLPAGTYDQRNVAGESWASGPFAAGNWTYNLYDSWDNFDDGAVGDIGLSFTPVPVPEPGSAVLLGVAALGLVARRRK